ncbi:MAG: hypothetical protein AAGC67_02645 [Myxococcota bacterium]
MAIVFLVLQSGNLERRLSEGARAAAHPDVDLGAARFPSRAGLEEAFPALTTPHGWQDPASRNLYRVAYVHALEQMDRIQGRHVALARRFAFEPSGGDRFRWRPPLGCEARPWSCIYAQVLSDNADSLGPLVDRFAAHFSEAGWTQADAARWALAFVQRIPYRIPSEQAFGIQPPSLVVSHDEGDCDSKSLLLMAILERLGIRSVLAISDAHAHAMVGIAVPAGGDAFVHRGRKYAWAETTARVPLGRRHGRLRSPDDWVVVLQR